MSTYRGQVSSASKIQLINSLKIGTVEEALAYLRTMPLALEQVAAVMQKTNMMDIAKKNKERFEAELPEALVKAQEEQEKEVIPVENSNELYAEEIEDREEFTEDEVASRIADLKSAVTEAQEETPEEAPQPPEEVPAPPAPKKSAKKTED